MRLKTILNRQYIDIIFRKHDVLGGNYVKIKRSHRRRQQGNDAVY